MNRNGRIKIVVFLLSIISIGHYQICTAQELTLTLNQVVSIAMERNPLIAVFRQSRVSAEARILQARSAYLPQITASADGSRQRVHAGGGIHNESNYYKAEVGVNQYVYDFGKTRERLAASRYALDTSAGNLDQTVADVILTTQVNYYQILKKKYMVKVNQESLDMQQKHLEEAKAFYSAGLRPKIDVTRGEVQFANTHLELIRARYALSVAKTELENILGGPPVKGPYLLADVSVEAKKVILTDALLQKAMEKRPAIAAIKSQIQAAEANLQAIRALKWPTVNANASYGWNNTELPLEDEWRAGVHLDWPLFTGYRTQGEVSEAQADTERIKFELKRLELEIVRETTQAVSSVNEALEAIKTTELAVMQSEENMELAQGRYKVGVGSAIEYSDAQFNLTQTRNNLVQAQFSYLQAQANLEHAIGKSFSSFKVQ
jgi:outer membrane protein TolC